MNTKLQLTQEGKQDLENELNQLIHVNRVKNLEDIKEARAQGDLSENADYDAARDQQLQIEKRIKEIENTLKNADIIESSNTSNLGKTVEFRYLDNNEMAKYKLVNSIEADTQNGKISNTSPVGKLLMKSRVGQELDVKTEYDEYKIRIEKIY